MDVYDQALELLLGFPSVAGWREMADLLKRTASKRPRHWVLPEVACRAVGGTTDEAIPGVAAIACFHTSIILIDDILDDDPRGEFHRLGVGAAANLAWALQAAGLGAIISNEAPAESRLDAIHSLSEMALVTAIGQAGEIENPIDEASYWLIVKTKSSPFFGSAFQIGALLGGASPAVVEQLKGFGELYGEMVQIYDDIKDTLSALNSPDWILARSPLPILFAETVDHPERERFLELRKQVSNPESLEIARGILLRSGAISYCVDQLVERYREAKTRVNSISLRYPNELEGLLEMLIQPVWTMFDEFSSDWKGNL